MLDLSTAASPQARKILKRSASTASLPTPPRTYRKNVVGVHKKRRVDKGGEEEEEQFWLGGPSVATGSNSKTSGATAASKMESAPWLYRVDNGEEQEDVFWLGDRSEATGSNAKTSGAATTSKSAGDNAEEIEDVFWLGGCSEATGSNSKTSGATATKLESAPLLYRKGNLQSSLLGSAPVSPPPSHRKPKTRPVTPKKPSPIVEGGDGGSPSADSADPNPSTPIYDKPYVTYVFRGRRRTYQNPHYDHAKGRPVSPPPGSKLPFEHPDYSPSLICPPKRLFTRASRQDKKTRNVQLPLNSPIGDADDDEVLDIRPKKLDFGTAKRTRSTRAKSSTKKRSS